MTKTDASPVDTLARLLIWIIVAVLIIGTVWFIIYAMDQANKQAEKSRKEWIEQVNP